MKLKSSYDKPKNEQPELKNGNAKINQTQYWSKIIESIDEDFLNSITDRIFLKDKNGKYIFWNTAACDRWNINPGEAIGKTALEIFNDQTAKTFSKGDKSVFKTGRPYHEEKYIKTNDGIEMPVSVTKNPLKDKNGKIMGLIGISRDAITLNQQVKSLQKENQLLKEQLKNLTAQLNKEKESNYKGKQFLNKAIKTARSAIFFIDAKKLKIKDCSPSAIKMFGYNRKEILNKKTDFLHTDASHLKKFRKHLYHSVDQKGFLFLSNFEMKRKDERIFPTEHTVFPIKNEQGEIIEWASIVRDQTERRWAQSALTETEDRYRMLVETMTDGLGIIDENGKIAYLNDKASRMIGYSREELLARPPLEFLDKANQKIFKEHEKNRGKGERSSYELTWTRKDGQKVHTIVSPRDIYSADDTYKGTFAIITDITARRQAEENLRESEEKYRSLVESTDDSVYMVDRNRQYLFMNKKYQLRHDFTEGKYKGKIYDDFHSNKTTEIYKEHIDKVFKTGKTEVYEHKSEKDDRYFIRTISPIQAPDGRITAVTVISKEITERVHAENALRESEAQLQSILKAAPIGIGLVQNRVISWVNDEFIKMSGYSKNELTGKNAKIVYENDDEYERVGEAKYDQIKKQGFGETETRLKRKSGKVIDVYLRSTAIDPKDFSKGIIFTTMDITKRKQAEDALRESEEKYRSLVDSTDDNVFIVDRNCVYQFMNPKALTRRNLPIDQILGLSYGELHDENETKEFTDLIKKVFDRGISVQQEHRSNIDGRYYLRTLSPIKGPAEEIIFATIISKDITERVLAETALQQEKELSESVINSSFDGILAFDRDCRYTIWNPGMERISGVNKNKALGSCAFDLFPFLKKIGEDKFFYDALAGDYAVSKEKSYDVPGTAQKGYFDGYYAPMRNESNEVIGGLGIIRDVTERKLAEDILKKRNEELKAKQQSLEDLNTTLKVLLSKRIDENKELEEKVLANVNQLIEPILEKLETSQLNQNQKVLLDILKSNFIEIISPFSKSLSSKYLNLTPSEIQSANFLKQGKTTKEIAELLNLSPKTVETHRKNIRKKLGLNNIKINLRSYLLTIQ